MRNDHPRLVIAGTHSGAGKTSVATAILAALRGRGVPVRPFKVGPDYIDPTFHAHVAGVPSRNLDSWLLEAPVLRALFARNAGGGIAVIEGVMGLFDGKGNGHEGSTAHVAELLEAPILLVLNAKGLSRSAAAVVSGYASFHPRARVGGVIVTMAKNGRHYGIIKNSVEEYSGVPCLGYLPEDPGFVLRSRHLGLVPSQEAASLDAVVARLARAAAETIDLDALIALAEAAPPPPAGELPLADVFFSVRIGVARDAAFSFYYQDGFDLLRELGAELVFFSPMRDRALPGNIHGLYMGGGFPEVFAKDLAANAAMRAAVRDAAVSGLPVYAECGGMAYLCASLTDADGGVFPMSGVFPQRVAMTRKLQKFGYAEAEFRRATVLGPAGTRVRTHEFHYSRMESGDGGKGCLRMRKDGAASWYGGLAAYNVLAAYPHIHFYSNPSLARNFLARCAAFKEARP
jgi:cobyrinic acid a,c-diamide synthase